jgi:hypothetical protein
MLFGKMEVKPDASGTTCHHICGPYLIRQPNRKAHTSHVSIHDAAFVRELVVGSSFGEGRGGRR